MSTPIASDPLGFSMEGLVAVLPTQEEREELALFIEDHLKRGAGAGVLRGFFLLLKAYRIFMDGLPERFRKEFAELSETMLRLEKSLAVFQQGQKESVAVLERSAGHAGKVAQRMEKVIPQIEAIVQKAFDQIDTTALSQRITETVLKSTVDPIAKTNEKLGATLDVLQEVLGHTERATKTLRSLSLPMIAGVAFLAALILGGSISAVIVSRISQAYAQRLSAAVEANGDSFAKLARLHAKVEVVPQGDAAGNPVPGRWALLLDGAETVEMKTNDPRRRGVVFFHEMEAENP
ncbi:MAG TPA: hypothetical protein VGC39_02125 [Candidatus Methylacidiphilales bacterium]